jgi:NADH-quinone oxidoreductase subunit M
MDDLNRSGYWLLATWLVPLATALVMIFIPSRFGNLIRALAAVSGVAMFALSLYVFVAYQASEGGIQFQKQWVWMENAGILKENGITLHLGMDGIAAPLVLLTGIVIMAGNVVSWKIQHRNKDFYILLLTLVAGVFGTFVALDMFLFFFMYELAVIPMYLLIAVWGSTRKEYGAMKLTVMLVAASVLIFIGIFAVFAEAGLGTFNLVTLWNHAAEGGFDPTFQKTFFPFMVIGCGVLGALWPFHTWSPDGHMAAPTAVSMLHAGVLMKLGAFGIIRLGIQLMPEGAEFWMPGLIILGTINATYGSMSALAQRDFKQMIGYSSVSHMGYVMMGLATLNVVGINGAVLQMFAHGVMTALFFAMVGGLYDQAHTREMSVFGGLAGKMPLFSIFFILAGLSSVGLPGLAGFVAEFNIFVGVFRTYPVLGVLAVLSAAVSATYVFRMFALVFFGQFNPRWGALRDLQKTEVFGGAVLAGSILFMGVYPKPFTDRITPSVRDLPGITDPTKPREANLPPQPPSRQAMESERPDADVLGLWLVVPNGTGQGAGVTTHMTPLPFREGVGG